MMQARVSELLGQIQGAQTELETIRANCKHESYHLGFWSWRIGTVVPSRICDACLTSIPGITHKEEIQCYAIGNCRYSDGSGEGLFETPAPLKSFEGKIIAATRDGVLFSDPDFESFYKQYEALDPALQMSVAVLKVIPREIQADSSVRF